MNFVTQSFEEFSSKLSTTDLALYAGVGLVLYVLFKDKLSPVQKVVLSIVDSVKALLNKSKTTVVVNSGSVNLDPNDIFFQLVTSWKQTRDLAVKLNCTKAVEVADQMFPYLSPMVCNPTKKEDKVL